MNDEEITTQAENEASLSDEQLDGVAVAAKCPRLRKSSVALAP